MNVAKSLAGFPGGRLIELNHLREYSVVEKSGDLNQKPDFASKMNESRSVSQG